MGEEVVLADGTGHFDPEDCEKFESVPGKVGMLYRTAKGSFINWTLDLGNVQLTDHAAFVWLIERDHQEAAKKYFPGLWDELQL
jgi:hypothetical protein